MKTKFEELKILKEKLPFDELNGKIAEALNRGEISLNDMRELFGLERMEDEVLDKHLITLEELGNRLQKKTTQRTEEKKCR